jgi:hypothetical protein
MKDETPQHLVNSLVGFEQDFQKNGYSFALKMRFNLWWTKSFAKWLNSISEDHRVNAEIIDAVSWLDCRMTWEASGFNVEVVDEDLSGDIIDRIHSNYEELYVEQLCKKGDKSTQLVIAWKPKTAKERQ